MIEPLDSARRSTAAVAGVGAVTAFGWSARALGAGLLSGETTVSKPVQFSTKGHRTELASEVPPPPADLADTSDIGVNRADHPWQRLSQADRFAVVAAREAWQQAFESVAADSRPSPASVGVFFGGSTAGMAEAERFFSRTLARCEGEAAESDDLQHHNPSSPPPPLRLLESQQLNGPGDAVARDLGAAGPVVSFSSACASGALALGAALEALRRGEVEVAVAGGSDSLCQMTYAGFNSLRAIDPAVSRPFRADRAGLNLGEGAGVVVLVNPTWAARLEAAGQRSMGTLAGAGASCDAHHMTAPHPEGLGAAQSMSAALADAQQTANDVHFVNTHGTGTPHNDSAEAAAIRAVFTERAAALPITSVKGAIGHLLGAAGAVEAVATLMAITGGAVQPTANHGTLTSQGDSRSPQSNGTGADPDFGVNLVVDLPRPLDNSERTGGLSNSFAFGGANASLVFVATGEITEPSGSAGPTATGSSDTGTAHRDEL